MQCTFFEEPSLFVDLYFRIIKNVQITTFLSSISWNRSSVHVCAENSINTVTTYTHLKLLTYSITTANPVYFFLKTTRLDLQFCSFLRNLSLKKSELPQLFNDSRRINVLLETVIHKKPKTHAILSVPDSRVRNKKGVIKMFSVGPIILYCLPGACCKEPVARDHSASTSSEIRRTNLTKQ